MMVQRYAFIALKALVLDVVRCAPIRECGSFSVMSSTLSRPRNGVSLGREPIDRADWNAFEPSIVVDDVVSHIRLGHTFLALTGSSRFGQAAVASLIHSTLSSGSMRVMEVGCGATGELRLKNIASQLLGKPEAELDPPYNNALSAFLAVGNGRGQQVALIVRDADCLQADAIAYLSSLSTLAKAAGPRIVFVGLATFWQAIELDPASALKDLVTARWTLISGRARPQREMFGSLPRSDNVKAEVPDPKSPAVASDDTVRVRPIPSRAEDFKRSAILVGVAVVALVGIAAAAVRHRQTDERPAAVTMANAVTFVTAEPPATAADTDRRDRLAAPPPTTLGTDATIGSTLTVPAPPVPAEPADAPPLGVTTAISVMLVPVEPPATAADTDRRDRLAAPPPPTLGTDATIGSTLTVPTPPVPAEPADAPPLGVTTANSIMLVPVEPSAAAADIDHRDRLAAPPPPTVGTDATIGNTPPVQAPPAPTAQPEATTPEVEALLNRGDAMLALADIAAARLIYDRAASLGSGHAATMIGKTYDPRFLATILQSGVMPDQSLAAAWYRRAAALGDPEAIDRLGRSTATGTKK
jgi:hypothetical protein